MRLSPMQNRLHILALPEFFDQFFPFLDLFKLQLLLYFILLALLKVFLNIVIQLLFEFLFEFVLAMTEATAFYIQDFLLAQELK